MIQVQETSFNSFPATVALERQLDSGRIHRSVYVYRTSSVAEGPSSKKHKIDRTRYSSSKKESFPDIAWCENDDVNTRWDEFFSMPYKIEDKVKKRKHHQDKISQGLLRSKSIQSKLYMLAEEDVASLPHTIHTDTTSFSFTSEFNLERLVKISVPHAHVSVLG